MPSDVVSPARASRSAAIVAVAFLVAGSAASDSAFADRGGGHEAQGPPSGSALAPGHAQDPPGRRAHGSPAHPAPDQGQRAGDGHPSSRPAPANAVTRHPSPHRGAEGHRSQPPTAESTAPPQNGHHKTVICHATGSATNPYVEIAIPPPAVRAHARHQDGRDIIPAPAGGCPGATAVAPSAAQQPNAAATTQAPPAAPQTIGGAVAALPLAAPSGRTATAGHGVLGVEASSNGSSAAPRPLGDASPAAAHDGRGGLPFTGFVPAIAAALGVALAAAGAGVRRHSRA